MVYGTDISVVYVVLDGLAFCAVQHGLLVVRLRLRYNMGLGLHPLGIHTFASSTTRLPNPDHRAMPIVFPPQLLW